LAAEKAAEIHHEVFMFKHKSVKLLKGGETKRPAEASPLANDSVVE
jgi:hypothetical protein